MERDAKLRIGLALAAGLATLAASALLVFAGSSPEESRADDGRVSVALRDGEIVVEPGSVVAGPVTVEVVNEGIREHELVILRTELEPDELPVGLHGVALDQAGEVVLGEDHLSLGHAHAPHEVLGLLPGDGATHRLDLRTGSYVVLCSTGGHYLSGEHAALSVVIP